jgi:hypothetical protein
MFYKTLLPKLHSRQYFLTKPTILNLDCIPQSPKSLRTIPSRKRTLCAPVMSFDCIDKGPNGLVRYSMRLPLSLRCGLFWPTLLDGHWYPSSNVTCIDGNHLSVSVFTKQRIRWYSLSSHNFMFEEHCASLVVCLRMQIRRQTYRKTPASSWAWQAASRNRGRVKRAI